MKKKLIGIPLWNQGDNSVGATKPYLELFKQLGSIVILGPDTYIENLDLLVLPGGKDLINGNSNDFSFFNSDGERFLEYFDANTLPIYIENRTPIYGICRGFQRLCNYFGMPITQDIKFEHGYSLKETDHDVHELDYYHDPLLKHGIIDNQKQISSFEKKIGSWHHQCVRLDDFNHDQCDVLSVTKKGVKVVEHFIHKELPIAGGQSHVERGYYQLDLALLNHLLRF